MNTNFKLATRDDIKLKVNASLKQSETLTIGNVKFDLYTVVTSDPIKYRALIKEYVSMHVPLPQGFTVKHAAALQVLCYERGITNLTEEYKSTQVELVNLVMTLLK